MTEVGRSCVDRKMTPSVHGMIVESACSYLLVRMLEAVVRYGWECRPTRTEWINAIDCDGE